MGSTPASPFKGFFATRTLAAQIQDKKVFIDNIHVNILASLNEKADRAKSRGPLSETNSSHVPA